MHGTPRRSSKVQGCARSEHCSMRDVLSAASPHSHVVSPLKYPHFFLCSLCYSVAVYGAQVWTRSSHADMLDIELCRISQGAHMSTEQASY